MVTMKELASRLNLSIGTVSLALAHSPKIHPETAKRVIELAQKLEYRPSNVGRALQSGRSRLIGCIIGSLLDSFFDEIIEGAGRFCAGVDYSLLTSWKSADNHPRLISQLLANRVDGVIFAGKFEDGEGSLLRLRRAQVPYIFASTHAYGDAPHVVTDDALGGRIAARCLVEAGHRRILIQNLSFGGRLQGATGFLADYPEANYELFKTAEELPALIRKIQATAVICFTDTQALEVLYFLRTHGVRVPEDVSLIGYDNLPIAARPEFRLTTVAQQRLRLGEEAARYLIERSKGETPPDEILLEPMLVMRDTVAKIG